MIDQSNLLHPANAALTLSVSDTLVDLGGIPPQGVRSSGGVASPEDLAVAHARGDLCELVDGMLVGKAMGFRESLLAAVLIEMLGRFVRSRKLGVVFGPDGFVTLFRDLVRGPDVAFISWDRLPNRQLPAEAYPAIVPELVVEIIGAGNTRGEMARKRREYFQAGVQLVWMIDPIRRSVAVFSSAIEYVVFNEEQMLDGGHVLPELEIPLQEIFAVLDGP